MTTILDTSFKDGRTVIRVAHPGPQGPAGGSSASNPFDVIYLRCSDDSPATVHAVRCRKIQGSYVMPVDQADSTP